MNVNLKKVYDQEPKFEKFCQEVIKLTVLETQTELFIFLYSMYQIGNSPKQVAQVINQLNMLHKRKS
jgi:hypothetical protein